MFLEPLKDSTKGKFSDVISDMISIAVQYL